MKELPPVTFGSSLHRHASVLLLLLLTPSLLGAFSGRYEGDGLLLSLQHAAGQQDAYVGTLSLDGTEFPLRAHRSGNQLTGTFSAQGASFPFTLMFSEGAWELSSEGVRYRLEKHSSTTNPLAARQAHESRNPLAGGTRSEVSAAPAGPTETVREVDLRQPLPATHFVEYKHPGGYSFGHPPGWNVQSSPDGILLTPGDASRDAGGNPLEALVMSSDDAEGISSPDDPQVLAYFRGQYEAGGFSYSGKSDSFENGLGRVAVYVFDGAMPDGNAVRHTIYVNIHDDVGIFMIHMAQKELVEKRTPEVRAIWASLGKGAPEFDMNLVGEWQRSRTSHSASGGVSLGSTTRTFYRFQADGSLEFGVSSRMDGHNTGVTVSSDGGWDLSRGTFHTQGSTLAITWDNGNASSYEYSVFMHTDGRPALKLHRSDWERPQYYR